MAEYEETTAEQEEQEEKPVKMFGGSRELMRERKRWIFFGIPWTFTKYILTEKMNVDIIAISQ